MIAFYNHVNKNWQKVRAVCNNRLFEIESIMLESEVEQAEKQRIFDNKKNSINSVILLDT